MSDETIDPAYDEHGLRRIDAPLGDEDTCFPGVDYDLLPGPGRRTKEQRVTTVTITIELPNIPAIDDDTLDAAMYAAKAALPSDDEADYWVEARLTKGEGA